MCSTPTGTGLSSGLHFLSLSVTSFARSVPVFLEKSHLVCPLMVNCFKFHMTSSMASTPHLDSVSPVSWCGAGPLSQGSFDRLGFISGEKVQNCCVSTCGIPQECGFHDNPNMTPAGMNSLRVFHACHCCTSSLRGLGMVILLSRVAAGL